MTCCLFPNASTPTAPEVVQAMLPYFNEAFGNPASIHGFGQAAKVGLEDARRQIADVINAQPGEIVFTSGGTEANNWALKGTASFFKNEKKHIITSTAEHHAVLYPCQYLEKNGFDVTYLPVDRSGQVSSQQVADAIRTDTCLVSLMHANSFWAVQFMSGNRQQVNVHFLHIERYFTKSLNGVRMKQNAIFSGYVPNLFDGI